MNPEELESGQPVAEESAAEPVIAAPPFGEQPEQPAAPSGLKRVSPTQWVIGIVVVALLGYPLVRRALGTGDSSAPEGTVAPANPEAQTLLNQSFALYQAHKYEESIAAGKALVKEYPKYTDGWNNLAASYVALGKWDDAIESAKAALALNPNHQMAKGNLALAEKAKATGAPPPSMGPVAGTLQYYLNLSAEDYHNGKFPECVDDAGKALKLDPNSSEAYNNRGACYGSLGMFDEEIQAAQAAVRLNPTNQLAKNNLEWALQRKKVRDSVRENK